MGTYAVSDSGPILDNLHKHHDGKIGFVIFRTDYSDDHKWAQFVDRLTGATIYALSHDDSFVGGDRGEKLKEVFAYNIRNNKEELEGASINGIRKHFGEWAQTVTGDLRMPKYRLCVLVDEEVINSVMEGEDDDFRGYVKLINGEHEERALEEDEEEYPAIGGCKVYDIGWMKQSVADLFPRAYRILMSFGWGGEYRRPPIIKED